MTVEELKTEASKLGYNIVKKPQSIKFEPCVCGANRRSHYYSFNEQENRECILYKCEKCGLKVYGKNERDAKINWNAEMRKRKSHSERPTGYWEE